MIITWTDQLPSLHFSTMYFSCNPPSSFGGCQVSLQLLWVTLDTNSRSSHIPGLLTTIMSEKETKLNFSWNCHTFLGHRNLPNWLEAFPSIFVAVHTRAPPSRLVNPSLIKMDLYGLLLSILIPFPGATSSWRPANFQTTSCAGGSPKKQ